MRDVNKVTDKHHFHIGIYKSGTRIKRNFSNIF